MLDWMNSGRSKVQNEKERISSAEEKGKRSMKRHWKIPNLLTIVPSPHIGIPEGH